MEFYKLFKIGFWWNLLMYGICIGSSIIKKQYIMAIVITIMAIQILALIRWIARTEEKISKLYNKKPTGEN